jgi:hypothetical protein
MVHGRGVVQVPAHPGKAGREGVQWLLGKAPAGEEAKAAAGPGLAVAMGADGRVLVVDPELRLVYRIDPATGAKELLAQKESWPTQTFLPLEVASAGGSVFVAGKLGERATTRRLLRLSPNPQGGRNEAKDLKVAMAADVIFTVTPDHHLLLWNGRTREAQFRANRHSQTAAALQETRAHAAAKAALERLIQAEERQARRKGQAVARHRQADTAAAPAERKNQYVSPIPGGDAEKNQYVSRIPGGDAEKDPAAGTGGTAPEAPVPDGEPAIVAMLRQFAQGPHFHDAFTAWIQGQGTEAPGTAEGLGGLLLRADLTGPGRPEASVPAGPARFALDAAVLERAVRWMLEHADQANDPMELQGWRRHSLTAARVTFGLSGCQRGGGVVLAIAELQTYASAMDAGAAPGPVTAALRATGGRTGIHVAKDGQVRFTYGLRVILDPGLERFRLIRPGGAQSPEHWDD